MFDINVSGSGSKSVGLQLSQVLLTPPLGLQLADIRSADLPLVGSVSVTASDVTLLPYVGRVGLIGTISPGNVNIQAAPGGFVIKGSVSALLLLVVGQGQGHLMSMHLDGISSYSCFRLHWLYVLGLSSAAACMSSL